FVAFDLRISDQIPPTIIDIGLSQWCLDGGSRNRTYHWQIKEPSRRGTTKSRWETDTFLYGTTKSIHSSEIRHFLSSLFHHFRSSYINICLVGHHVQRKLDLLQSYAHIPDEFIIIDTQRVWQAHCEHEGDATLGYCLESTSNLNPGDVENNSGNAAHAILELTKYLGQA
ncbi:hypothetical protein GGR58DRAFT_480158, partial [Xylaria digitata]